MTTSLKRISLDFDDTIRWLTCVWSQQVYWKRPRYDPLCRQLINLVMFWVIVKRKWSWRHCWKRNNRQRMLTKVLMNWHKTLYWRRNIWQRMLTQVMMNWQIRKRQWSKYAGRVWINFFNSKGSIGWFKLDSYFLKTTFSTIHS